MLFSRSAMFGNQYSLVHQLFFSSPPLQGAILGEQNCTRNQYKRGINVNYLVEEINDKQGRERDERRKKLINKERQGKQNNRSSPQYFPYWIKE